MKQPISLPRVLLSAALVLTFGTLAQAEFPLKLELDNGMVVTGEVSSRSNQAILWIAHTTGATLVLRPIHWSRIAVAELHGKPVTVNQLRYRAVAPNTQLALSDQQLRSQPLPAVQRGLIHGYSTIAAYVDALLGFNTDLTTTLCSSDRPRR